MSSPIYRAPAFRPGHPLAIPRVAAVVDFCRALGWLDDDQFIDSPMATEAELARFHDPAYVAALRRADAEGAVERGIRQRYRIGTPSNPVFAGMFRRAATAVGGSMLAARLAAAGRSVFHPPGGTHHGRPDRASGFCYFNDPVFAILTLLDAGLARVAYVDLDAHHGDGVQDAFADDARVFTLSIHETRRWPHSGGVDDRAGGWARNLPVPRGFNDSELDFLVTEAILPLLDAFDPEALVVVCGADGLDGDPMSGMALSNVALWDAVLRVVSVSNRCVLLGGGGYNPCTLVRCWSGLWGRLCGHELPAQLPGEALRLLGKLSCRVLGRSGVRPDWLTTLADEPRPGPVRREVFTLARKVLR